MSLLMISADSHAGPRPEEYHRWLEKPFHEEIQDLIRHEAQFKSRLFESAPDEATMALIDSSGVLRNGGRNGLFDPQRRMQEMEAEGFVGQVIFNGDPDSLGMFFNSLNRPYPANYRAAGVRGYNRWLAEFCSYSPSQMVGVAQVEPWPDMAAAVDQVREANRSGLRAVMLPRYAGIYKNQPFFGSTDWEPFWHAAAEAGLTLCVHVGNGSAQGEWEDSIVTQQIDLKSTGIPDPTANGSMGNDGARDPLWWMIRSGVFDRHPTLRLSFTEIRSEWIAPTLDHIDSILDSIRKGSTSDQGMPVPARSAWEYWHGHCAVAGPLRPSELASRDAIGVDHIMFGSDYPHPEGSWPNSLDWLAVLLDGVPLEDAQKIVGLNAVRFYGFDMEALTRRAAEVGPDWGALTARAAKVNPAMIDNFQWRSGFLNRAVRYDSSQVDALSETLPA